MPGPHAAALPLLAHPAAPCAGGLQPRVVLVPDGDGWRLRFTLTGDLNALAIPEPLPPGPADGLWQHTCFEAFVGTTGSAAYREFNFSPSGQWAAYRFSAERVRDPATERSGHPPVITCERSADTLDLRVWLPPALLPEPAHKAALKIGLNAVIETRDGQLSYWALQHPRADRPDFHHPGGWVHRLPPTPSAPQRPA
ncbi:MAG: DOMON-like domain-containing protein [Hydrogenophaga sp.]|uniref:DOMON-like domain-containing protein n=1 Tax=Hydrogenophaga sp. TaxID=1904254 RepID=UPI0025BFB90D|nr:DOMON-like domain-containing protein [Hydrogenophaga sp.]MBT9552252.1 DOMON-like domain-containing protein [Hydrogenophaga sp.]